MNQKDVYTSQRHGSAKSTKSIELCLAVIDCVIEVVVDRKVKESITSSIKKVPIVNTSTLRTSIKSEPNRNITGGL